MFSRSAELVPSDPVDSEVSTSSRRELLTRLAGLGLVAAGGFALLPDDAEAKKKARRKRRRGKQQDKAGARKRQQGGGKQLGAQVMVSNPRLVYSHLTPWVPPFLIVSTSSPGYVRVSVTGTILFTAEHVSLMKLGRKFRVTCAVWESDLPDAPDHCFNYSTSFVYPRVAGKYPRSDIFSFVTIVPSSYLNHDVDDGWWDSDDDKDDPYGLLTLSTKSPGSRHYLTIGTTRSNEHGGYY